MSAPVLIHGLVVASDVDVGTRRPAPPARAVDLRIARGDDRPVPDDPPPGRPFGELRDTTADRPFLGIARTGDGTTTARVHGVCDLVVDGAARAVSWHADPAADLGLVPVVAGGLLLALVLELRGAFALHASAVVDDDGTAVAVVGSSGMGKSTLAALCCADGAPLLGDDIVRVDLDGDRVLAHPGSGTLRVRPGAASVADPFGGDSARSADDRVLVAPPPADAVVELGALVVPLRRPGAELSVRRLRGAEAALVLARFPRLLGVLDPAVHARRLDHVGRLAARVPVLVADLPSGPPFPPGLGRLLLAAARQAKAAACMA